MTETLDCCLVYRLAPGTTGGGERILRPHFYQPTKSVWTVEEVKTKHDQNQINSRRAGGGWDCLCIVRVRPPASPGFGLIVSSSKFAGECNEWNVLAGSAIFTANISKAIMRDILSLCLSLRLGITWEILIVSRQKVPPTGTDDPVTRSLSLSLCVWRRRDFLH